MPEQPLCARYDVGLFDLDGVVYAGDRPIEHAASSIQAAKESGMRVGYVTNNASRTPEAVAQKLERSGVPADVEEIITSAQVAAQLLAERLKPGDRVLVVGDEGLRQAVSEAGLSVVLSADDEPAAVVQGHSPDTGWRQLSEAIIAVRAGALWVATNTDATIPTDRGVLAGNGAFVKIVGDVLGREPDAVAGKPDRTMHRASVERTAARHALVIGDRLDTDIAGAAASDCDSLYVMTGVSTPAEVVAAPSSQRPTYVASDLRGLLQARPSIRQAGESHIAGRWRLDHRTVTAHGEPSDDDLGDYLTLAAAARWAGVDAEPGDDAARDANRALGLKAR